MHFSCSPTRSYYSDNKQAAEAEEQEGAEPEAEAAKQLDPEELLRQAEEEAHIDQVGVCQPM